MGDSCIICLEELGAVPEHDATTGGVAVLIPSSTTTHPGKSSDAPAVAVLKPCNHVLHDECVREWSQKANSCPICRQQFNLVEVLDKLGGTVVSEYEVEDKKQVAEFDPTAWLEEEEEEEEDTQVCPVCLENNDPEILLLCDLCDASYHTTCIGLGAIPSGNWFCIECNDDGDMERAAAQLQSSPPRPGSRRRIAPRTQASVRRNRQFARIDRHIGAWGIFSNRIHGATGLDLDFVDDDGGSLADFRQLQARADENELERRQWQRRLDIASAQGAGTAFINSVPARIRDPIPQAPVETIEETRAWGAFERAQEVENATPKNHKRKSRSVTASPAEAPQEPERKLKRPRTRRVLNDSEPASHPVTASMGSSSARSNGFTRATSPSSRILNGSDDQPSFLSKILKEVEMAPTSDDDRPSASTATTDIYRVTSPLDFSSPAASPTSSSSYHTSRGSSNTPPPVRSGSPLSMTSRIEARYPPAAYSPNRSPPMVDSELDRARQTCAEIRQPRPRRRHPTVFTHSELHSPRSGAASPVLNSPIPGAVSLVRSAMSAEAKEGINRIVKNALAPHWRSAEITKEQYAEINRFVSRKLYGIVADRSIHDERQKSTWEKIATAEVAQQVKSMVT